MSEEADKVFDAHGVLIQVGATVVLVGGTSEADKGTVTRITDWDGDMAEGRMVGWPPRVYVRFPDCEDDFISGMRPDERTYCDDLEVIA